ncbi:hypothetical protein IV203_012971 [Nitzschia inconspicua]|uniref:Uncharacterized protein n=1 Tax=Nitzschia inconspicua TaxID=303405 RepID=A0A9K3M7Y7_9STRA|nr:hypothetical protein IV203_012971 [Nitzschia inconspicua]
MAIPIASSAIQQRWSKTNKRSSLTNNNNNSSTPQDSNLQCQGSAKRHRGDRFHALFVFWNNFFHSMNPLGKLRSIGVTMLLCVLLGILLFHPPCYRKRAKGMPLCRLSRGLGITPALSSKGQSRSRRKQRRGSSELLPPQERTRIVMGFMTTGNNNNNNNSNNADDDNEERHRRRTIRNQLLRARDRTGNRVCCLQDYLDDPEENRECIVVYTFLMGGNPDGDHLDFNKTYSSTIKYEQTSFFSEKQSQQSSRRETVNGDDNHNQQQHDENDAKQEMEEDIVFLNVQDTNNVRKVFAWFDYASKLRMELGRKFDYVGITDTEFTIDSDTFLSNDIFQSTTTIQRTYGGIQLQTKQCHKRHNRKDMDCLQDCTKLPSDLLFMSDFVVLSRDLVDYCLAHNNLVQLTGVFPQDCPDLAIANLLHFHPSQALNSTHLDGIVKL